MSNKLITIKTLLTISFLLIFSLPQIIWAQKELPQHVILIGVDGLGAYSFPKAKIPHMRALMQEGCYSLKARAVLPSSSAVNWMSILSGSPPELHGYTEWGSKTPEVPSSDTTILGIYPTLLSLLSEQKPQEKRGVIYTWGGIGYLFKENEVNLDANGDNDSITTEKAIQFLQAEKPLFTFIHFSQPDGVGHNIGHDTPEYYEKVEWIDGLIGQIVHALKKENMYDESVILITSDHGGTEKGHGGKTLVEMEIPWIISGKGIKAKGALEETIITYDSGTTLAYFLGLKAPQSWRGQLQQQILK